MRDEVLKKEVPGRYGTPFQAERNGHETMEPRSFSSFEAKLYDTQLTKITRFTRLKIPPQTQEPKIEQTLISNNKKKKRQSCPCV
jgi:hypothetical protein